MPYDGVIGSVDIEPQQIISIGQTVITIQGESGKEFEIGVPAEQIANIKPSMPAKVSLGALPGRELAASISEISPDVDSNGTYPVILLLADKDDPAIRAGMDGECTLNLPNPNGAAMLVPASCIVGSPGGDNFVWIVDEPEAKSSKVQKRVVKTVSFGGEGEIEVIDGLTPGETIVTRGVHSLDEGQVVALSN